MDLNETDTIELRMTVTVRQARYLRRKWREQSRQKLNQAKKDRMSYHYETSHYFGDHVMLEAFVQQINEYLKDE